MNSCSNLDYVPIKVTQIIQHHQAQKWLNMFQVFFHTSVKELKLQRKRNGCSMKAWSIDSNMSERVASDALLFSFFFFFTFLQRKTVREKEAVRWRKWLLCYIGTAGRVKCSVYLVKGDTTDKEKHKALLYEKIATRKKLCAPSTQLLSPRTKSKGSPRRLLNCPT